MSLHYPFPVIETIDDVLPYIDNNFRVVEKEGLTFINYSMMGNDTFPAIYWRDGDSLIDAERRIYHRAAVRRECRGIAFNSQTGEIASRPFHKFFNAGEREELAPDLIDVSRPHIVLEKLDGSMVRPLPMAHGLRWGTKMGVTDVALLAEEWVSDKDGYLEYAEICTEAGFTPLFEFCSNRARVVVSHPEERLVLIAVRNNRTGVYKAYPELCDDAARFGLDVVAKDWLVVSDMSGFVEDKRREEDGEGIVLRFHDGHMIKVKNDWYTRIHRAKDLMRSERRVIDLILNEEIDDLLPSLPDEDRAQIERYVASFWDGVRRVEAALGTAYLEIRRLFETKKDFATGWAFDLYGPAWRAMVFALWDGKQRTPRDAVLHTIMRGMASETNFAQMKAGLGLETGWESEHIEREAA